MKKILLMIALCASVNANAEWVQEDLPNITMPVSIAQLKMPDSAKALAWINKLEERVDIQAKTIDQLTEIVSDLNKRIKVLEHGKNEVRW